MGGRNGNGLPVEGTARYGHYAEPSTGLVSRTVERTVQMVGRFAVGSETVGVSSCP